MTIPLDIETSAPAGFPAAGAYGRTGSLGNNQIPPDVGEAARGSITTERPILSFIVHGQAKPKGSMRHVGHGRMIEQVNGKPWREAVKWAAIEAMRESVRLFPLQEALRVEATFTFAKPASAPKRRRSWPITRASGDCDKQLRNLFDALQDADVMRDDAQIIEATVAKRFPLEGSDALTFPGVYVRIYLITGP